jgi:hypothetical protein
MTRTSLWIRASVMSGMMLAATFGSSMTQADTKPLAAGEVVIRVNDAERRADVTVDGKPFTSYIWPEALKKPALHPIRTAAGLVVTRGYPPEPGERADHPHHVGLWFNHGNVNGFDFWNNTDAVKPDRAAKMGTVQHKKIRNAVSGKGRGQLDVTTEWIAGDGKKLLDENTSFVFSAAPGVRTVDRLTSLTASGGKVTFTDSKEGVLGLRVRRALEDPNEKSGEFVEASGGAIKKENADTSGVTGEYISSEGKKGKAVWGTRGRWTFLSGTVDAKPVTIVILDHPENPGFPTYWHARGYGLFAANPLGESEFTNKAKQFNFALESGEARVFRHRVVLLDKTPTTAEVEALYEAWVADSGSAKPSAGLLH